MSNIVFFGQADAGKSTLAGYLVSKYKESFNILKFIESMEKEYPGFDVRLTYSAIINTNKDEQRDLQHHNSKATHLRKITFPFEDVTIIDTPGTEFYTKQRERGMYYGNIGVFFMEINNILNGKYSFNTIAPIILWSKLKNKRIIFLLTKFDMVDYSEKAYIDAVKEVHYICQGDNDYNNICIIPTAIEVNKLRNLPRNMLETVDIGENISCHSDKMTWYSGPCLIEALEKEINYLDKDDRKEVLSFCIIDQMENPYSGQGKAWLIKILSGILNVEDDIILAPVKAEKDGGLYALRATVRELRKDISRHEEKVLVNVARKGEIYGLDLKNCFLDKKKVKKADFNAVASTCGFSVEAGYNMSEYFSFVVKKEDRFIASKDRELRLLWFGRSLPFYIKEVKEDENVGIYVIGLLKTTKIALPKDENNTESIVIKGDGNQEFYNAQLIRIGQEDFNYK